MSCKSALYAANTLSQTVAVGETINFGSIVRRFGCACTLSGGNVVIDGSGYYDVSTNFTLIPSATGTVTISLYKDGTLIPGAEQTISATAGDAVSMSIPCIIRSTCCCEFTLTAILEGVAGAVTNAAIAIEKL